MMRDLTETSRCSDALRSGDPLLALPPLLLLHASGTPPRLGSLTRWTRDVDAVRQGVADGVSLVKEPSPHLLYLLDRMLRCCDPEMYPFKHPEGRIDVVDGSWACCDIRHPRGKDGIVTPAAEDVEPWRAKFTVVHREEGAVRRPPNRFPLLIHLSQPNAIGLAAAAAASPVVKVDVPFLPGAFTLLNVLSPDECDRIVSAAESVGYVPDAPQTSATASTTATSVLAHNFVWLLDEETERIIYSRVLPHLPAELDEQPVMGINRRWYVSCCLPPPAPGLTRPLLLPQASLPLLLAAADVPVPH